MEAVQRDTSGEREDHTERVAHLRVHNHHDSLPSSAADVLRGAGRDDGQEDEQAL